MVGFSITDNTSVYRLKFPVTSENTTAPKKALGRTPLFSADEQRWLLDQAVLQHSWDPLAGRKTSSRNFYVNVVARWIEKYGYLKYIEDKTPADVREDLGENLDSLGEEEKFRVEACREECHAETHLVCDPFTRLFSYINSLLANFKLVPLQSEDESSRLDYPASCQRDHTLHQRYYQAQSEATRLSPIRGYVRRQTGSSASRTVARRA
jgi:hypothetical protein